MYYLLLLSVFLLSFCSFLFRLVSSAYLQFSCYAVAHLIFFAVQLSPAGGRFSRLSGIRTWRLYWLPMLQTKGWWYGTLAGKPSQICCHIISYGCSWHLIFIPATSLFTGESFRMETEK
jgi:hypothetical protein